MSKIVHFYKNYKVVVILWLLVSVFSWGAKNFGHRHNANNYFIFERVYYHTRAQTDLYKAYPIEYGDTNHYGPVFSLVIAPFALLPDWLGFFLFTLFNMVMLMWAVSLLPLPNKHKMFILLFSVVEYANAAHYIQFNAVIAAIIVLSFLLVENERDGWASMRIALGTLIKLYPIVGLVFFPFSKHKLKFVISGLLWLGLFFVLPMLISSKHFVVQSYMDWYNSLHEKNLLNINASNNNQDISFMGTFRALFHNSNIPNTPFLIFAALMLGLPLLRFRQYVALRFRLSVLASALMVVVLFSSSSEHPTYIIAVTGALIWIFMGDKPFTKTNIVLLILLVLITGLGPTDAFPRYIRHEFINKYVMKAWPCIIVWLMLSYDLLFKNFNHPERLSSQKLKLAGTSAISEALS